MKKHHYRDFSFRFVLRPLSCTVVVVDVRITKGAESVVEVLGMTRMDVTRTEIIMERQKPD